MKFKAQTSAPFELLVAVIIMTFVLVVGINALNTLNEKKCEGEIDDQLEDLKTAIQTVATGKGQQTVSVNIPLCFGGQKETKTRIVTRDDRSICSSACGGSASSCTLLLHSSPQLTKAKCLYISLNTIFPTDKPCDASEIGSSGEYETHDLKSPEGIENGIYLMVAKHSFLENNPIVCAYLKKG